MLKKRIAEVITLGATYACGYYMYRDIVLHRIKHGKYETTGQKIFTYVIGHTVVCIAIWAAWTVRFKEFGPDPDWDPEECTN